jgi:uncharacterized protein YndB with AHSA1/START domain
MNEKTISKSEIINRSQQDIWDYITTPETWKMWYVEDDLKSVIPDWQEGGVLHFTSGQQPTISEYVPPAYLRWGDSYVRLTEMESTSTKVEYGYVAKGFLVEDPLLWADFQSSYLDAVADIMTLWATQYR